MDKLYINAIGKTIIVDTGLDIHDATVLKLRIKKPNDVVVEWVATLEGLTKLKYTTTTTSDLDQAGRYLLQAYVETPSIHDHGYTTSFEVYALFK